jgi:predicted metalloprotease
MTSRKLRLLAAPPLLLLLVGGAFLALSPGNAEAFKDNNSSETMEQYLTSVTKDVDAYWTQEFKDSGLPEPRVSYDWIPAGETGGGACGTGGDDMAAYCPNDDTIYVSQNFATNAFNGTLDQSLPGASQGYGSVSGDMAVAYIVAHEYGHQGQNELGLDQKYANLPTMDFELQADCYAGDWAKYANDKGELEDGDVDEALNAALAVGDFDTSNPGHHGTPDQREEAWTKGFQSGDPQACMSYLSA